MNSKVLWGIIAAIVILGGIYFIAANGRPDTASDNALESNNEGESGARGRVVFSITDAAVNMDSISEVNATVSRVEVYNQSRGWVTVSTVPRTYNLLKLDADNQSKLLADATITSGEYTRLRMTIDSVSVKPKTGSTAQARLPGKMVEMGATLIVSEDTTSSVNFDVLADKSLHITEDREYIFAPVVKTETKSNAQVTVDTQSTVNISGGNTDSSNTVGMDLDGTVKVNFELNAGTKLDIDANNLIRLQ